MEAADDNRGRVLEPDTGVERVDDPLAWSQRDLDPAERQRRRALARYQRQQRSLRRQDIRDERLAKVLSDALSATTPTYFANHGVITDERHDPDHGTRLKALDRAARAIGWEDLSIEAGPVATGPVNVQIVLEAPRGAGTGFGAIDPPDAARLGVSIRTDGSNGYNGHGRGGA